MTKKGWVIHNKKAIKIGGPTWEKLSLAEKSKLVPTMKKETARQTKSRETSKKVASSPKARGKGKATGKGEKKVSRLDSPKLFEKVAKDLKKEISPKGWVWLEVQVWETLTRLVRLKTHTGFVSGEFSLERCLNGIKVESEDYQFFTEEKDQEVWNHLIIKTGREDLEYGFLRPGEYVEGILFNIIFESMGSSPPDHSGPVTDKDLVDMVDSEILEWAVIFGRSYAMKRMVKEIVEMPIGLAIDSFAAGRSLWR
jgi:hypothetical protein